MSRGVWAALAGAVAVGLALGVGELLAGMITGVPSLVSAVGSALIPVVPPAVEDWAIRTFGTSDKLVLEAGTVVVSLGLGLWAGALGRHSLSSAVAVFVSFAGIGLLSALSRPLVSPLVVVLTTVAAAGTGVAALVGLLWLLGGGAVPQGDRDRSAIPQGDRDRSAIPQGDRDRSAIPQGDRDRSAIPGGDRDRSAGPGPGEAVGRRQVVGALLSVSLCAVVAGATGRSMLLGRTRGREGALEGVEPVRRLAEPVSGASFDDVPGLTPVVVPNGSFYRIDTALVPPSIDPDTWRLRIHGMVGEEVELTYSELLGMDLVEAWITLACVSNEIGGDLVGNAKWLGVPLGDVLALAGVREEATQVVGRAVDGWTAGFPVEVALDGRDALVAVGMNEAPLPVQHGFPVRLVVPGLYGYVSATKWLTEIELTTFEAFDAYWVPRGWARRAPIRTQSRIDVPRDGAVVPAGQTVVAGVAWAGHRGVRAVEVRVDGGPWRSCALTEPLSRDAWRQFRRSVELTPGEHVLEVRAADGTGEVQTGQRRPPRPDGATGHHRVRVRAEKS